MYVVERVEWIEEEMTQYCFVFDTYKNTKNYFLLWTNIEIHIHDANENMATENIEFSTIIVLRDTQQ